MEIKRRDSSSFITSFKSLIMGTKTKIVLCLLLWTIVIISVSFTYGALMLKKGRLSVPYRYAKAFVKDPTRVPLNYIYGQLSRPERIYIDVKYEDFQRLAYSRRLALESSMLYGIENDYVKAQIRHEDKIIPVNIRLKGGIAQDHLGGEKWSLRVAVRGENALLGMRKFSLMDPRVRHFLMEWLLQRVMRKEGLIAKRYKFVEVFINGKNKGIYAIDEHYDNAMIEANQRKIGPLVSVHQHPAWFNRSTFYLADSGKDDYYFQALIDGIGSEKIMSDEMLSMQFKNAVNLFEAFRNDDLLASEVFDVDVMAKWMAIGDVLGRWHGFGFFNMKFYYNPLTSKLEPVPDDNFNEFLTDPRYRIFRLDDTYNKGKFLKQLFKDLKFLEKYLHELERVSKKSYMDNILSEFKDEIEENMNIIHKDNPYWEFPTHQLYKNQERLREILNPYRGIVAYFEGKQVNSIILGIATVKQAPIEILNITDKDGNVFEPKQGKTILHGKYYATPLVKNRVEFKFPSGFSEIESVSKLKVNYKILGATRLRSEFVIPRPFYDSRFIAKDIIRQKPNFKDFEFIEVSLHKKKISVKPGYWKLNRPLMIPEGYSLIIKSGTQLDLINGAFILSYSSIKAIGSDDNPILISSSDSTGRGIAVFNAKEESLLTNVIFKNLKETSYGNWQLTAAVTFYKSQVSINKCRFFWNKSEDALNIVQSRFIVSDSFFSNNKSDALDVDFSNGIITNTRFIKSGNDAIDFSGAVAHVSKCLIDGAGDKAISVGEGSHLPDAQDIEIRNSRIAIASKDTSEIHIVNYKIHNSEIGFAAYQKKPEFGPGTIKAFDGSLTEVQTEHLIEEESMLVRDHTTIKGSEKEVAKRIYKRTPR